MRKKKKMTRTFLTFFTPLLTVGSFFLACVDFNGIDNNGGIIIKVISFIASVVSFFIFLVLFIDKKFNDKFFEFEGRNNLDKQIEKGLVLSKFDRIESRRLLEIESEINDFFNASFNEGNFIRVTIFTNCFDANETAFIDCIEKNIRNGCEYVYITDKTDKEFLGLLFAKLAKKCIDYKRLKDLYDLITKRIFHKSAPEYFQIMPKFTDLIIYSLQDRDNLGGKPLKVKGFFSVQDKSIKIDGDAAEYFYYEPMEEESTKKLLTNFNDVLNERLIIPYVSGKVRISKSLIQGKGYFADKQFSINEVVCIKGGNVISIKTIDKNKILNSYFPINDEECIGAKPGEDTNLYKLWINHSCEPNVIIADEKTFISREIVNVSNELTVDYAFIDNVPYRFKCNCKNTNCRKIITGFDWQLKEVKTKYKKEYFSSYIQSKIDTGIIVTIDQKINKQIKFLRESIFVEELGFQLNDEFDINESKYLHCCLYKEKELIAYARVSVQDNNVRIGRVAVKKDERKKNYGRQIMFWAETEALKNDRNEVEVHALKSAMGFYEHLGYKPIGEEYSEEGKPHILMTKHLELDT